VQQVLFVTAPLSCAANVTKHVRHTLSRKAAAACDSRGGGWLSPFAVMLLQRIVSVDSTVAAADASSPVLPPKACSSQPTRITTTLMWSGIPQLLHRALSGRLTLLPHYGVAIAAGMSIGTYAAVSRRQRSVWAMS
jgi:hypothetical protein